MASSTTPSDLASKSKTKQKSSLCKYCLNEQLVLDSKLSILFSENIFYLSIGNNASKVLYIGYLLSISYSTYFTEVMGKTTELLLICFLRRKVC